MASTIFYHNLRHLHMGCIYHRPMGKGGSHNAPRTELADVEFSMDLEGKDDMMN
jgi:hypothetical protein